MINNPKVSILMNGYNAQKYLKEAIDSIYAQTFEDWEIIFIDNCSTDNTKKIVDSFDDKTKYYKTEKNISLGAARNFGLQYCKGEYLAFLDTDDIWFPKKLELQLLGLEKSKAYMSFTSVDFINIHNKIIDTKIIDDDDAKLCNQFKKYTINMQTVVINKKRFLPIFDETLTYAPDYKLFMSILAKSNGNVIVLSDVLVQYRIHSDSLSNKSIAVKYSEVKGILLFLKEHYSTQVNDCLTEFNFALLFNKINKAEYYLSENKFYEAAKIYKILKDVNNNLFIKSIFYKIPVFNKLFYNYLQYKNNKKLL